jgi:small subunit ribosomal protein S16
MQRFGRRHRPFYRINAIEKRNRRNGRVIENLGWYDPAAKDEGKQVELKADRIQHWLDHGAQPSDTVEDLLARANLLSDKRRQDWEARRATAKARVVSKTAIAKAEAAVTAINELAGASEASLGSFVEKATAAHKAAQDAVAKADIDGAQKAQSDAEAALDAARKLDADAKAKKAAEEAKAAAEAAEEAAAPDSSDAAEGEDKSE